MEVTVTGASAGPIRLYAQLMADENSICSLITPNYEGCKKLKLLEAPFAPSLDDQYHIDYKMIFVKETGFTRALKMSKEKKSRFIQVRVKTLAEQEYIGWDIAQRNKRTQDTIKEMKNSVLSDIVFVKNKATSYSLCFARITLPGDHDYKDEDTFPLKLEMIHKESEFSWAIAFDGLKADKAKLNPIRSTAHFYLSTMMVGHPKFCLNLYHRSNESQDSGSYILEIRPIKGSLVTLVPLLDQVMGGKSNIISTGNAINRIRISVTKKGEALVRLYSTTDFNPEEIDEMFQKLDETSVGYISHHSTAPSSKIYYVRLSAEQNFCLVCYSKGNQKKLKKVAYGFAVPVKNYETMKELVDTAIQKPGVVALKFQTYNSHGGYDMVSKVDVKGGIFAFSEILKALVAVVYYDDMVGVADCIQSIGFELDHEGQACIEIIFSNRALETHGTDFLSEAMNKSIYELKDAINSLSSKHCCKMTESKFPESLVTVTPPMPQVVDINDVSAFAGSGKAITFLTSDYWIQLTKGQLRYANDCFSGDKFLILSLGIDFPEVLNYNITSVETASKTYLSQVMHFLSKKAFIIVEMPENDIDRCTMTICTLAEDGDHQLTVLNKSYANTSEQLKLVLPWIVNSSFNYCDRSDDSIEAVFEFYDQSNMIAFMYFLGDFIPNVASAKIQRLQKVSKITLVTDEASIEMAKDRLSTSGNLLSSTGDHIYAVLEKPSYSLAFFDRKAYPFINVEKLLQEKSKCQAPKSGLIPIKITRNKLDGDLLEKVELAEWRFGKRQFNPQIRIFLKTLLVDGPAELISAFSELRFVPSQQNFKVQVFLSKKLCGSKSPVYFRELVEQSVNGTKPVVVKQPKKKRQPKKKGLKATLQQSEEDTDTESLASLQEQIAQAVESNLQMDTIEAGSISEISRNIEEIEPKQHVFITLLAKSLESSLFGVPETETYQSDLLDAALSFSPTLRCPFKATYGDYFEDIHDWDSFGIAIESMIQQFRKGPIGPFEVSPALLSKTETVLTLEHDFSLEKSEALLYAFEQLAYHMLVNSTVLNVGIIKRSETIVTLFMGLDNSISDGNSTDFCQVWISLVTKKKNLPAMSGLLFCSFWLLFLARAALCMNLGVYGKVRLFAKSSKEDADLPYRFIVTNLENAIQNDALECPFASSPGYLLPDIEFLMMREGAFNQRFLPHGFPFPSMISVPMKLVKTLNTPTPSNGKTLFATMFRELEKYPRDDCVKFKTMQNGRTQISFYHHMTSDISVDDLLSDKTCSFDIETGHSGRSDDIWELNLKGSFKFFFAPIDTSEQLGTALNFVGSKTKELFLTNRHYHKNDKHTVIRFDHLEDNIQRLMPVLNDMFSCDFNSSFGSRLAAVSFVPRAREKSCRIKLFFSGTRLDINHVMKWVKSLEACGIGYVHETLHQKSIYGVSLRNRLLRVVQPLYHRQRKDSLFYGATTKEDFDRIIKRMELEKPGVALRFGHFACSESHRGVVAIETLKSNAYEAFKFAVDTLIFANTGKMAKLIESVVVEFSDEDKAVVRVVFLFDVLESTGEEALLNQVQSVDFGPFNPNSEPETMAIAAFASIDGHAAYPLGSDFWKSVSDGKFFSPEEVFCKSEHQSAQLLLISPAQISRGISDVRIVATDEIDYADLMKVMDLVNEESLILVRHSLIQGKLIIQVGRWEKDSFPEYKSLGVRLCLDTQVRSMEHYLCLKPWAKSARFPEDAPEASAENSFGVQFLEGSQHLFLNYVKEIIESKFIGDVISLEFATGPFVCVSFADKKHIKTLRNMIKSKGVHYQSIAKNHLALFGDLPLFVNFPATNAMSSKFRNVDEFMRIKAQAVKKVPYINFTVERRSTDQLLMARKKYYKAGFPVKRYNIVISAFLKALTDKSFPCLALPFARLEVVVHNKYFKLSVYVMEYLGGLGADSYGKLLVRCADHLEKYPGAKGKIGNPALRPVKIYVNPPVIAPKPVKSVQHLLVKSESKSGPDASALEAPATKALIPRIVGLSESLHEADEIQLFSPEQEEDWRCYYEIIKEEAEFTSALESMRAQFVDLVKKSSVNFRPDLGEGYRFVFCENGPVAVARTWNGFSLVMKLAMEVLRGALRKNGLDEPFVIQIHPSLLNGQYMTRTQCFHTSPDNGSMDRLLDAFESLAFNLMHDTVSACIIRIGVSRTETTGLYHIFADIVLPSETTPEYLASMDEFDLIWRHVVVRGSQYFCSC